MTGVWHECSGVAPINRYNRDDSQPTVTPEAAERIFRFWDRDGGQVRGHGMGPAIARHLARAVVGDLHHRPHHPMAASSC